MKLEAYINKLPSRLTGSSFSRIHFPFSKHSNQILESMSFLVLPQHDCNFNLYPEGLSVFAPFRFRHLKI